MTVLIIMTWLSGYVGGAVVTVQEFSSLTTCENAKNLLLTEGKKWTGSKDTMIAWCVSK